MQNTKCSPPFGKKLVSFVVNGTILSYIGYKEEVAVLLNTLCSNSREYQERHIGQIEGFLKTTPTLKYIKS